MERTSPQGFNRSPAEKHEVFPALGSGTKARDESDTIKTSTSPPGNLPGIRQGCCGRLRPRCHTILQSCRRPKVFLRGHGDGLPQRGNDVLPLAYPLVDGRPPGNRAILGPTNMTKKAQRKVGMIAQHTSLSEGCCWVRAL